VRFRPASRGEPCEKEKYIKKHRYFAKPVALAARSVNPASAYGLKEAKEYWKSLGHTVRHDDDGLCIKLANDGQLYDYGDHMVLHRAGPPTEEDLRIMVAAARTRGWKGIYFYGGGDPEWRHRARAEAIRQGYPPESISLECEKNRKPKAPPKPTPVYPEERMPTHLLKKLGKLPAKPSPAPKPEPNRGLRFKSVNEFDKAMVRALNTVMNKYGTRSERIRKKLGGHLAAIRHFSLSSGRWSRPARKPGAKSDFVSVSLRLSHSQVSAPSPPGNDERRGIAESVNRMASLGKNYI